MTLIHKIYITLCISFRTEQYVPYSFMYHFSICFVPSYTLCFNSKSQDYMDLWCRELLHQFHSFSHNAQLFILIYLFPCQPCSHIASQHMLFTLSSCLPKQMLSLSQRFYPTNPWQCTRNWNGKKLHKTKCKTERRRGTD